MDSLFLEEDKVRIKSEVLSSELTTFKLGSPVPSLYEPQNIYSLLKVVKELKEYQVIGNGSNVVLPDTRLERPVVRLPKEFSSYINVECFPDNLISDFKKSNKAIDDISSDSIKLLAFGSCSLMKLSSTFSNLGFSGLEFGAGIPASIAGAAYMNAGAHGNEISEVVNCIYVISKDFNLLKINKEELIFNYRKSNIDGLIVAVGIELTRSDITEVKKKRKECLEYRKNTQPLTLPSAGSVFKNIVFKNIKNDHTKRYAAELIESLGLKGRRVGGVEFSKMHSNWLVKIDNKARTEDFITLVQTAKDLVQKKYSLKLDTEIKLL